MTTTVKYGLGPKTGLGVVQCPIHRRTKTRADLAGGYFLSRKARGHEDQGLTLQTHGTLHAIVQPIQANGLVILSAHQILKDEIVHC